MDKKFIEKAQSELREDDLRRSQTLAQFRDWLSKHPFLQGVRRDDSYLLQYLRSKKFNVEEAFNCLERGYLGLKRYPQFMEHDQKKIDKLFSQGYCYPLSGRDSEGRRIIHVQTGKLDPEEFTINDAIRLFRYVVIVLMEEEETQIAGIICIFNHADATLKHLGSPVEARDFMEFVKNCSTSRQKANIVMNLPSYALFLLDLFRTLMTEKLKKRLFVLKSPDELKNHIDQSLLPKELGGVKPEAEMMAEFLKLRDERRDLIDKVVSFELDCTKIPPEKFLTSDEHGTVGSFRKLEID